MGDLSTTYRKHSGVRVLLEGSPIGECRLTGSKRAIEGMLVAPVRLELALQLLRRLLRTELAEHWIQLLDRWVGTHVVKDILQHILDKLLGPVVGARMVTVEVCPLTRNGDRRGSSRGEEEEVSDWVPFIVQQLVRRSEKTANVHVRGSRMNAGK